MSLILIDHANFIIIGSRYNGFGTFKKRGPKETIYCFNGCVRLQKGDTSKSFEVPEDFRFAYKVQKK